MKVRVRFYAHLRDLTGKDAMEVDLPDQGTVAQLLEQLCTQTPALRSHDTTILVGAGVEFVDRNYVIQPGEEISVMPPVQGG